MRTQNIYFPDQQALCVFPDKRSDLEQAVSELGFKDNHPVIVLIGGSIDEQQADVTRRAIQTISKIAEDMSAIVICGGTDMGVMTEIGLLRWKNRYKFPLVGVAPEELVTWPDGPHGTKFLWMGKKRWQLASNYSHFILVPGGEFGDESQWIVDAATILSKGHRSVTILINGGEVSRKDIELSLENSRPVIALSHTGRLADEFARQPNRNKLITVAPAHAEARIVEVVHAALVDKEENALV
jgi:predicted Rossmann-fold nucleotide-binding protein